MGSGEACRYGYSACIGKERDGVRFDAAETVYAEHGRGEKPVKITMQASVSMRNKKGKALRPFTVAVEYTGDFPKQSPPLQAIGDDGRVWESTIRGGYRMFAKMSQEFCDKIGERYLSGMLPSVDLYIQEKDDSGNVKHRWILHDCVIDGDIGTRDQCVILGVWLEKIENLGFPFP